jgi:hypothetical protein
MFKQNVAHLQTSFFGLFNSLSPEMKKKAKASQEYCFYKIIFCNIKEKDFSVLFSDNKSRPNAPVNALVSAIILMNKNKWTYKDLFDNLQFHILAKVALGLDSLEEMPFCEATIFNFQNRLLEYYLHTGQNLFDCVFDGLTQKQLTKLKLKTNIQRTDSFALASNIRSYTRLQLLVEVIIRIWRILTDKDKERFIAQFKTYIGKTSGQYIYNLARPDIPKELDKIGQLYCWIDQNLKSAYADKDVFQIFKRVYEEHFCIVSEKVEVKNNDQLTSDCLQSPDDLEAAYRNKNGNITKGYSGNVTETAHPDNPINLITDVAVGPVNKDDSQVLNERLDTIKEKTPDLDELHFDGGFGSAENDLKFEEHGITAVQTAIKGSRPAVDIEIALVSENEYQVSCPFQTVTSRNARKRFKAEFQLDKCSGCQFADKCPATRMAKSRVFYFTVKDYLARKRQGVIKTLSHERRWLRNNVEATVHEFTCKMSGKKLKVRGSFKAALFVSSLAIGINFGRIYRYLQDNPANFSRLLSKFAKIFKEQVHFMFHSIRPKLGYTGRNQKYIKGYKNRQLIFT